MRVLRSLSAVRRLPLLAGLPLLAVACASDPKPEPVAAGKPDPAHEAKASKAAEDLAKVTADDCRAWADRFRDRVREANERRIKECDAQLLKSGGTPAATSENDLAAANAEADRLHSLIVDQCGAQAGASFSRSDSACYLGSARMEDWMTCRFKSQFFGEYAQVAHNHKKLFDARCRDLSSKT